MAPVKWKQVKTALHSKSVPHISCVLGIRAATSITLEEYATHFLCAGHQCSNQHYSRGICHIFPCARYRKQQPALHSRNMPHISCVLGTKAASSITLDECATYFVYAGLQSSNQLYTRGICHIFPVCWALKQQPALHSRNMPHISCVLGITASITLEEYATHFLVLGIANSNQHYSRGICHIFPVCWVSHTATSITLEEYATYFLCAGHQSSNQHSTRGICHIFPVCWVSQTATSITREEYATYFLCAGYHKQQPALHSRNMPHISCVLGIANSNQHYTRRICHIFPVC